MGKLTESSRESRQVARQVSIHTYIHTYLVGRDGEEDAMSDKALVDSPLRAAQVGRYVGMYVGMYVCYVRMLCMKVCYVFMLCTYVCSCVRMYVCMHV